MTVLSQSQFSQQMVAQLRLLNPSISSEVGTPERLIIDTVALQGANLQIDLTGLSASLDVNSKYGSNLDNFVGLFGFQRIQATQATGFVDFYCIGPAATNVTIPIGTTLTSQNITSSTQAQVQFITTATGTIEQGQSDSGAVPIQAVSAGSSGNIAANLITIISTPGGIPGVSSVNNTIPTSNGVDQEDDNSLKVRFRNTVFRNLSGTEDQFLALAISTLYSTKANVVGPTSTYQEYVQVPLYDDAGYSPGTTNAQPTISEEANGTQGQYTTALSTIPYASSIYTEIPVFISNGQTGANEIFFRQNVDFNLNSPSTNSGDTYRENSVANENLEPYDTGQPNVTFYNVFSGSGNITAVIPGGTYLLEYYYQSSASRNDIAHNVTNAVDVYVDGSNPQQGNVIFPPPSSTVATFNDNPVSPWYLENYRREEILLGDGGGPVKRPMAGNFFTSLFQTPLTRGSLPTNITVGNNTYSLGTHYWLVHDVSNYGGSTRSRDGIEWSHLIPGVSAGSTPNIINGSPYGWGINDVVSVQNYSYDQNMQDLQAALLGVRQVTTDLLGHSAKYRFFKLDITVVYSPGATASTVNLNVQQALQTYFAQQYFGSVVRLSDLLQIIHGVSGIDNVRWTNDFPSNAGTNFSRVIETDYFGVPLLGVTADRIQIGTTGVQEIQQLFINGNPQSGSFTITSSYGTSAPITVTASGNQTVLAASAIQTAINGISGQPNVGVTQDTRTFSSGVADPVLSYTITYSSNGVVAPLSSGNILSANTNFIEGEYLYDWDFFLRDNELPLLCPNAVPSGNSLGISADTLPGLIIRPRAQNTWILPPISSGSVLD